MRRRYAVEHFAQAGRLTAASRQQAPTSILFAGSPPPMLSPKSDYETSARLARRAIQSAATVLLSGDEGGAIGVLGAIDPVHPAVMERHVRPESAIRDGFARYLGLTTRELAPLRRRLAPILEHAEGLVARHARVERVESGTLNHELDVLLLPQTSYQLWEMTRAVADTELSVAVVDSSAAAGDQGVADLLERGTCGSFTVMSYNEAVLGEARARVVVLSYPWDGALEALASRLADIGASVVHLGSDLESTLRLGDAQPSRLSSLQITSEELTGLSRTSDVESVVQEQEGGARSHTKLSSPPMPHGDAADVWTIEEYPDREFDAADLARFKGTHARERLVIIGNGPSLNDLDLSLLKGTHTMGVNGVFYLEDRLPGRLSYYVVEDTMVLRDNLERIRAYEAGHRFFPSIYREMIGESSDTTFFMMNRGFYADASPAFCVPRFSTNPAQRIYAGQSVTLMCLQLAYYMGFEEVILIGMDFSYTIPKSSRIEGVIITSMGDDPNHFHPDYFGKGKVWKDPKLDRVLANYALAKQIFEADGRRIINATPGGDLHLFERASFRELFGR